MQIEPTTTAQMNSTDGSSDLHIRLHIFTLRRIKYFYYVYYTNIRKRLKIRRL
jgi:hypothetical protein